MDYNGICSIGIRSVQCLNRQKIHSILYVMKYMFTCSAIFAYKEGDTVLLASFTVTYLRFMSSTFNLCTLKATKQVEITVRRSFFILMTLSFGPCSIYLMKFLVLV